MCFLQVNNFDAIFFELCVQLNDSTKLSVMLNFYDSSNAFIYTTNTRPFQSSALWFSKHMHWIALATIVPYNSNKCHIELVLSLVRWIYAMHSTKCVQWNWLNSALILYLFDSLARREVWLRTQMKSGDDDKKCIQIS